MVKKRKASKPQGQNGVSYNACPTKFDANEEFADSEDEFYRRRDKILLEEGPEAKRRRIIQETSDLIELPDEEILGYESEITDEEEPESEAHGDNLFREKTNTGRRTSTSEDEDENEEEDENMVGWGSKKQDYYDADVIETEADALEEEQEARRIQNKRLQAMSEADFGFDESEWLGPTAEGADKGREKGRSFMEKLPQLEIDESLGITERVKILKARYPEFEPLAKDLIDLQSKYEDLQLAAAASEAVQRHKPPRTTTKGSKSPSPPDKMAPMAVIKLRALSSYLGAINMYFALLSSPGRDSQEPSLAMPPAELREHPIMDSLVKSRKLWEKVRDLPIPDVAEMASSEPPAEGDNLPIGNRDSSTVERPKITKKKRTNAERREEKARAEAATIKAERLRKAEKDLADVSALVKGVDAPRAKSKLKTKQPKVPQDSAGNYDDSDFGDEMPLTAQEVADKARRKKSLRFYTSEIAQKANRRVAAGRDAGGDADLPYKERLKDRQARLNAEAEKRGQKLKNKDEELGGESDDEDRQLAEEIRNGNDEDDYYDLVAARGKQRRAEKRKGAGAAADGEPNGTGLVEDKMDPDGKRVITYAMEKNKGLTPKRKKDVRNPRVKKRKKYDEKQKKLGSMRQVYKGGEGRGGYAGELTGIKKNLVRSVKL